MPGQYSERTCETCGQKYRKQHKRYCSWDCNPQNALALLRQMLEHVPENNACLEWPRSHDTSGYGLIGVGGKKQKAHRLAYREKIGPIPDGLKVCHKCDNPPCFRPDHLFVGSDLDNRLDCVSKGRANLPRGDAHPRSKLTEKDVLDIRARLATGESQTAISQDYPVTNQMILRIDKRLAWRHI